MTKKKNIQASEQNLINSQDGSMNSSNVNGNVKPKQSSDFQGKSNPAMQPGSVDTKNKY